MGLLRLLLAIAVAYGHSGGIAPMAIFAFLNPYYAVQAFFVISGFYMGLIAKNYNDIWLVFYLNRYTRLIISFWLVALITLLFSQLYPEAKFPSSGISDMPPLAMVANLFLFGADWAHFFNHNNIQMTEWLFIPQSWSLGTELCFYLLVPLLSALRSKSLILIILGSILTRIAIIKLDLPFFPWQQRFFPAELGFFLVGMLSYKTYVFLVCKNWCSQLMLRLGAMLLTISVIIFSGHIPGAHAMSAWSSLLLAGILYLTLPLIFAATRYSKLDRWLGEFSYPIYLWHIFVIMFLFSNGPYFGEKVVVMSILLSLPLMILVERPLERWRQTRVRKAKAQTGHLLGLPA